LREFGWYRGAKAFVPDVGMQAFFDVKEIIVVQQDANH
jgi:hypothetical protein